MRWNDDLLAGFDLSQKSKVKEVKEKSKEKREKIPGTDFITILRLISLTVQGLFCQKQSTIFIISSFNQIEIRK